ncbi:hypothetical protein JZ751_012271 [Albula glossodonta]|uniref:Uncharacterized protein n=1 Tax=Albula glossodonta TaxID=121402 RepID=A0A8T2PRX4_9TELE|nr:hypothetical protein JZ751_012271 [Albula glossodonta]
MSMTHIHVPHSTASEQQSPYSTETTGTVAIVHVQELDNPRHMEFLSFTAVLPQRFLNLAGLLTSCFPSSADVSYPSLISSVAHEHQSPLPVLFVLFLTSKLLIKTACLVWGPDCLGEGVKVGEICEMASMVPPPFPPPAAARALRVVTNSGEDNQSQSPHGSRTASQRRESPGLASFLINLHHSSHRFSYLFHVSLPQAWHYRSIVSNTVLQNRGLYNSCEFVLHF